MKATLRFAARPKSMKAGTALVQLSLEQSEASLVVDDIYGLPRMK